MLSVFLYSSFVCLLGSLCDVNAVLWVFLVLVVWVFVFLFVLFFKVSVTLDEEQADWILLASAVPSCLKDNLHSCVEFFLSFCIHCYQI